MKNQSLFRFVLSSSFLLIRCDGSFTTSSSIKCVNDSDFCFLTVRAGWLSISNGLYRAFSSFLAMLKCISKRCGLNICSPTELSNSVIEVQTVMLPFIFDETRKRKKRGEKTVSAFAFGRGASNRLRTSTWSKQQTSSFHRASYFCRWFQSPRSISSLPRHGLQLLFVRILVSPHLVSYKCSRK